MKLFWKAGRIILLSLLLLYATVLLFYYGRVILNQKSVEKHVGAFLKAVQEQHVQEAVEQYGGVIDMESMRVLLQEGSRLLSYSRVKAEFDDGCVCGGHVDLTFEVNGKPLHVSAIFTLGPGNKPSQICALTPSGTERGSIPALSGWNRNICGGDSF